MLENNLPPHVIHARSNALLGLLASHLAINRSRTPVAIGDSSESVNSRSGRLAWSTPTLSAIFPLDQGGELDQSRSTDAFLRMVGSTATISTRGCVLCTDLTPPDVRDPPARAISELRVAEDIPNQREGVPRPAKTAAVSAALICIGAVSKKVETKVSAFPVIV